MGQFSLHLEIGISEDGQVESAQLRHLRQDTLEEISEEDDPTAVFQRADILTQSKNLPDDPHFTPTLVSPVPTYETEGPAPISSSDLPYVNRFEDEGNDRDLPPLSKRFTREDVERRAREIAKRAASRKAAARIENRRLGTRIKIAAVSAILAHAGTLGGLRFADAHGWLERMGLAKDLSSEQTDVIHSKPDDKEIADSLKK